MNLEPYFVPGVIAVMTLFLSVLGAVTFYARGPR